MSNQQGTTRKKLNTPTSEVVNKKTILFIYMLWFFLGIFGAHRFYLGTPFSAFLMLLLTSLGWLTMLFGGISLLFFIVVGAWWFVDAFIIFAAIAATSTDMRNPGDPI